MRGDGWNWYQHLDACRQYFVFSQDLNFSLVLNAYRNADDIHLQYYNNNIASYWNKIIVISILSITKRAI